MKLGYLILCLLTIAVTFREAFSQPSLICAHAEEYLPPDHICRVVFPNNTLIMVPNPHQTLQYKRTFPTHRAGLQALVGESISQANDYINLLSQPTNCSDNIYFLVCLYYFPTCTVRNDGAVVPAYPCLHVCEEVNERCSERLKKAPGKQFTNCSSTYYDAEVVHGVPELPVFVPKSTDRRVCSSPLTPTTDPSPETAAKPTSSVTTAQPCPDYHSELPKGIEDATIRCRARRSKFSDILSKSQLKRYKSTYAINCTITEVVLEGDGIFSKRAIKCKTNHFFSVSDTGSPCRDTSLSAGTEVYILGYPISIEPPCQKHTTSILQKFDENSVGKTYIIAGKNQITHCDQKFLYLEHRSIIVEDKKKISMPSSSCPKE